MNRLTEYSVVGGRKVGDLKVDVYEQNAFHKLARYEDTGLTPEEVEAMICASHGDTTVPNLVTVFDMPLARVRTLVESDQNGKCVLLPCKVGDTVYDIVLGKVREKKIIAISFLMSASTRHLELQAQNSRGAVTPISPSDFGKTVFITREEASAAIGGGQK